MTIETSPLFEEVEIIMNEDQKPVHHQYRLVLRNAHDIYIEPIKLFSIDIERDYVKNFTDKIIVDAIFPLGTYQRHFIPYKQQLYATLTRYSREELEPKSTKNIEAREYRAVLLDESSDAMTAANPRLGARGSEDMNDLIRVEIQLMSPAIEEMRMIEVGGIYPQEIPLHVVRYILNLTSSELELPESEAILGIDMVPPDNTTPNFNIVVPHGTKPWDVADYIQDQWGGCYNAGMGCYLQERLWYLWPLYNLKRYDSETRSLTVINLPPLKYPGAERTYRVTEYQVIIISTGESGEVNPSHHEQLSDGGGTRFAHGDSIIDGFGTVKDNKFTTSTQENLTQTNGEGRPDNNFAPINRRRPLSNNSFSQFSHLSPRKGTFVQVVWENSVPEFIYPGMPTKFVFGDKAGEVVELNAVVVKCHHYIHDVVKGIEEGRHIHNTTIGLFVERYEVEETW